jgi:hypothetical protein
MAWRVSSKIHQQAWDFEKVWNLEPFLCGSNQFIWAAAFYFSTRQTAVFVPASHR